MVLLIVIAVLMVAFGALFGGAETGIYQLSRLRLRVGIENKKLPFVMLGKLIHDSPGLLLSLLIGNNLVHYIITSIVTYLLLSEIQKEHTAELFATVLTAPVLFVFSELVPKNIFYYRADLLMPYMAPVLYLCHKVFTWCGAVPLLKLMSGLFGRLTGSRVPAKTLITAAQRDHIRSIFQDTHEEGVLSSVQVNIINRLVSISHIRIRSAMTPLSRVQMVDIHSDKPALMEKLKECDFTRVLVYEGQAANIVGFVDIYEALGSSDTFTDLHSFIKPIRKLRANTAVTDALYTMRTENQKIVLVMRTSRTGRERPIGIVTMKDLAEELLGELAEW